MADLRLGGLSPGQKGLILSICGTGHKRRRLYDMGLTAGSVAKALCRVSMGGPVVILARGTVLAIRRETADAVRLSAIK